MAHSPLNQFAIEPIIPIQIAGYDISFTNSSLFMLVIAVCIISLLYLATKRGSLVPNRLQATVEILYNFVATMITDNAGKEGMKYFPLIFTLFIFILIANLVGMIPYGFTVTSHIIVTFALAMLVFIAVTIIAFLRHGARFFSFFLPEGTPLWLAPLMILIELFTYLSRPVSLSMRLAANMIAGHALLKVLAGFIVMLGILVGWLPIPLIVVLTGFEIFVAALQAYIFTILTCVYLNDAINLH